MKNSLDDLDFSKLSDGLDQEKIQNSILLSDDHDDSHDDNHDDGVVQP
jgi:hypothetical protein